MYVRAPAGTNIEETERRIARFERFLQDNIPAADRKMIIAELGLVPDWSVGNWSSVEATVGVLPSPTG